MDYKWLIFPKTGNEKEATKYTSTINYEIGLRVFTYIVQVGPINCTKEIRKVTILFHKE